MKHRKIKHGLWGAYAYRLCVCGRCKEGYDRAVRDGVIPVGFRGV